MSVAQGIEKKKVLVNKNFIEKNRKEQKRFSTKSKTERMSRFSVGSNG